MNWEAIGAIGEIIGAISVLATLIFLSSQLRQNTITLQQQSSRSSASALQQVSASMMDPNVSGNVSKAYAEIDPDLSISQTVQLEHMMMQYLLVFQQDFLDWDKGLHPSTLWDSRLPLIDAIFVASRAREWWKNVGKHYFTPSFQKLIDKRLESEARDGGEYFKPLNVS